MSAVTHHGRRRPAEPLIRHPLAASTQLSVTRLPTRAATADTPSCSVFSPVRDR